MSKFLLVICCAVIILTASGVAEANLISCDATASSEWYDMPVTRIVDGSGLNTANNPPTHSAWDWSSSWETMYYQYSAWVIFDLKGIRDVDSFRVWNFNLRNVNGPYMGRGAKDVDILTKKSDGDSWTSRGAYVFDMASGMDDYIGQMFSGLAWQDIRYIKFDIKDIWGYGDTGGHVGLSEVQFYDTTATVPEPATLSLLGLGLLGLVCRRKKIA